MATWTIIGETALRHRPIIDGAIPLYGGLDLTSSHAPDAPGIVVEFLDPSQEARRWLPDIIAGFEDYEAERSNGGRPIGAVRLTVTKVHWHPVDTNSRLMKRLAKEAIGKLFDRHGREVAIP